MRRAHAVWVILGVFLALFWPCLFRGWVIYPHDNALEMGASPEVPDPWPSNRKFSDTSSAYVPEVHEHLNGDHAGWLATWTPHVELGRPLGHAWGFSPAFPLVRVLSWTTSDAMVLLTRVALVTFLLAALFAYFFLEELGVRREAACAVALAFVFGPYSTYWITCPLFVSGWCWTFLALWCVAGFARAPTAWRALGIAFGSYALLSTSYQQQIVWHAYVLVPFALVRGWRGGGARRTLAIAGCALAGALCTLPVYADMLLASQRSARLAADHTFFEQTLFGMTGTGEPWLFLAQLFDAFWIGDPMDEGRAFSGVTLTPFLMAGLALVACGAALRRAWPWLIVVVVGIGMAFSTSLYLFGVDHLGLSLSRYAPMAGALIPAAVAAAWGLDAALRGMCTQRSIALLACAVPPGIAIVRYADHAAQPAGAPLETGWVLAGSAVYALTVWAALARRGALVVALGAAAALLWGRPELLVRPRASIHTSSPFVEELARRIPPGTRYAGAGDIVSRLLPPNQECLLGLASIHSYNSLSAREYQDWSRRVSEHGTRTYGRQFRKITGPEKLADGELAWAGVGLIASEIPLDSPAVERAGEFGTVTFYVPKEPPVLEAQFARFELEGGHARVAGAPSAGERLPLTRTVAQDDRLAFATMPSERETLLFVSQQHHPQWSARSGDRPLATVLVNGFYQGVVVPPRTSAVELAFEPWARWSWLPQLLFVLAAAVAAVIARTRARAAPPAPADRP